MKALLVILAALFCFAHPTAVCLVLGAELTLCTALGFLVIVRYRYNARPRLWRRA